MKGLEFYEATAQVIPLLLIVLVVELRVGAIQLFAARFRQAVNERGMTDDYS